MQSRIGPSYSEAYVVARLIVSGLGNICPPTAGVPMFNCITRVFVGTIETMQGFTRAVGHSVLKQTPQRAVCLTLAERDFATSH